MLGFIAPKTEPAVVGSFPLESREFVVKTADGRANLYGVIDFPHRKKVRSAQRVIFFVGGSFSEADGLEFSAKGVRFAYLDVAYALVRAGYVVVRFDQRGILRGSTCAQKAIMKETRSFGTCFDDSVRSTMTIGSRRADIESVYRYFLEALKVREAEVIVVGHSEGGYFAAQLVGERRIHPYALMTVGTPLEPLGANLNYRHVDEWVEKIFSRCDQNVDGVVTNAELSKCHASDTLTDVGELNPLLSPVGYWNDKNRGALLQHFSNSYKIHQAFWDSAEPHTVLRGKAGGIDVALSPKADTLALVNEDRSLSKILAGYRGKLVAVLLRKDAIVTLQRQSPHLEDAIFKRSGSAVLILDHLGHSFLDLNEGGRAEIGRLVAHIGQL